jgi:hypothetical protein
MNMLIASGSNNYVSICFCLVVQHVPIVPFKFCHIYTLQTLFANAIF